MSRRASCQPVLDAEVKRWSAMPLQQIIAALKETQEYSVELDSTRYQVEVELLENTETYIHVMIAVDDGSLSTSIVPLTDTFLRQKNDDPKTD